MSLYLFSSLEYVPPRISVFQSTCNKCGLCACDANLTYGQSLSHITFNLRSWFFLKIAAYLHDLKAKTIQKVLSREKHVSTLYPSLLSLPSQLIYLHQLLSFQGVCQFPWCKYSNHADFKLPWGCPLAGKVPENSTVSLGSWYKLPLGHLAALPIPHRTGSKLL